MTHPHTRPSIHYFRRTGERLAPLPGGILDPGHIPAVFAAARDQIFDRFASETDGLDLDRIATYFDDLGLHRVSLLIIDHTRAEELTQLVHDTLGFEVSPEVSGAYLAHLDTAFVFRNRDLEDHNGPEYTESVAVHELGHGSARHQMMRAVVLDGIGTIVDPIRLGHIVQPPSGAVLGRFWEEGFAEYLSGRYVSDVLGLPRGLARRAADTDIATGARSGRTVQVPTKYFFAYPPAASSVAAGGAALAAAALDLLVARDPALLPALLRARCTVTAQREVIARINALAPGLYRELRDHYNEEAVFLDGLYHLTEALDTDLCADTAAPPSEIRNAGLRAAAQSGQSGSVALHSDPAEDPLVPPGTPHTDPGATADAGAGV
ncbi:hypothetical protein [Nocardia transvalensis]|uniref:hypothetical protein n=1 Tax=Nocardia transvalensis TaxID=37333 RepID=UPI001893D78D|nr:hypothetical protein [Nocardia transvalensis]MBF6333662.1 hypothetical protein [Nocardia transvalensis]